MRVADLETRVLGLVDAFILSGRVEDDRVEAKRQLGGDHQAYARQLAGLANASGSDWVLWLVGVDEKARRVHPFDGEISSWWRAISAKFDGLAPVLEQQPLVRTQHGVVQALLFNVERRPYLVKVAAHGSIKGVSASAEVPWREGSATRTANREDLLRVLVPRVRLPELDARSARLAHDLDGDDEATWSFSCELYASLAWSDIAIYPDHLCTIQLNSRSRLVPKGQFRLPVRAGANWTVPGLESRSYGGSDSSRLDTIADGYLQVVVTGSGYLKASCDFESASIPAITTPQHSRIRREPPLIEAVLSLKAAGHDLASTIRIPLAASPLPLIRPVSGEDKPPRSPLVWGIRQ